MMKTQIGYALTGLDAEPASDPAAPRDALEDEMSSRATQPWMPSPAAAARAKLRRFDHIEILRASQAGLQRLARSASARVKPRAVPRLWLGAVGLLLILAAVLVAGVTLYGRIG